MRLLERLVRLGMAVVVCGGIALTGCQKEEEPGTMEEAVEEAGDEMEEAGEKAGDAMKEMGEEAEEAADEME